MFCFYYCDGFEIDKQYIICKVLIICFIFFGWLFGNGFIDVGFWVCVFGEVQGFVIGLLVCFMQLCVNQEVVFFFVKIECMFDGLIGNFFVVSFMFLFGLFGQFCVFFGELCFQCSKVSLGLCFGFLLFVFQNGDIVVQGNQFLLLCFDFCLILCFFLYLLFKLLFQCQYFLVIEVFIMFW